MRYIASIIIVVIFIGCNECDFSIPQEQRDFLANYSVGDTIYFHSLQGIDIDTILITQIDSIEECGYIMAGTRKTITIKIKHLPLNRWSGGAELYQDGSKKILNQSLIYISKPFEKSKSNNYSVGIKYRDFIGKISNSDLVKDDYLKEFGISQYWKIRNKEAIIDYANDTSIISLIWTKEFGLTEYTKKNGNKLRISLK